MRRRKLHKKILFWVVLLPLLILMAATGWLFFPGWSAGPVLGIVEDAVEKKVAGLRIELGEARLRAGLGGKLKFEAADVNLGDMNGEPTLTIKKASVILSLGRLMRGKIMPDEVKVTGFEVWARIGEDGRLQLPNWVVGLAAADGELAQEEPEGPGWEAMELGKLPAILRLEGGDRFEIAMEDYAAHLIRGGSVSSFVLPSLYVALDGRHDGVDISWSTVGWESAGEKLVSGSMEVNVFEEEVVWANRLNLPLTPALADWLRAGFPFLPIPHYLETGVHLSIGGRLDVRAKSMQISGTLNLAAGRLVLPNAAQLGFGIPAVGMEFSSELGIYGGLPRLKSDLTVRIGEGEGAALIRLNADVDGANDSIAVESLGNLRGWDELLGLLPEDYRPVEVRGDLSWQARLETVYSAPTAIRIGSVELSSGGIEIGFAGRLEDPLRVESFSFGGRIEQAGKRIHVAPFHLTVGPLKIRGSGLDWLGDGSLSRSEGIIILAPFSMAEILSEIPAGLLQLPEELSQFLDTVDLEYGQLGLEVGPWQEDVEDLGIILRPAWRFSINGTPLSGGGRLAARVQQTFVEWDLLLAEFNPRAMDLPYLDAYAQLESALSVRLKGDFNLEGLVGNNRIEMAASKGAIFPGAGIQNFIATPIALEGAHCVVNIGYSENMLNFNCAGEGISGLGEVGFQLEAEPVYLGDLAGAQVTVSAGGHFYPANTADLLNLLNAGLLEGIPITRKELADFCLESVSGTMLVKAGGLNQSVPQLLGLELQGDVNLLLGAERLSIHGMGEYLPTEGLISIDWKMPVWNIGRSNLNLADRLPIPLESLKFPVSASGRIQLPYANDPENLSDHLDEMKIDVQVELQDASIGVNSFLASAIEIPWASLHLRATPIAARLDWLDAGMKFMGGDFFLKSSGVSISEITTGKISGGARTLPFGWIPACVPVDMVPPEARAYLDGLMLLGRLDEADFAIELGVPHEGIPLPMVADFSASAVVSGLGIRQQLIPAINIERLGLSAVPDQVHLEILNAGHPFALLPRLEAVVNSPLSDQPWLNVSANASNDLAGLGEILSLVPEAATVRALMDQFGIDGIITHELEASLHMDPTGVSFDLDALSNLEQFAVRVEGLARSKGYGEAATVKTLLGGRVGMREGSEGALLKLSIEFRDLFLDYFQIALGATIAPGFQGPFGGLNHADFQFNGMDYSDLGITLQVMSGNSLKFEVLSRQLNIGPLLQLIEPAVVAALDTTADGTGAVVTDAITAPAAEREDASDRAGISLPQIEVVVELNRIQFGNAGSVGPFRLATALRDILPTSLEFEFASGQEWIRFAFQPEGKQRNFFFNLSNLGHWISAAVLPVHVFTTSKALENPMLSMLKRLPEFFANGDLSFDGYFALDPSPEVLINRLSLAGLVLQAEVPFLSRIASLVNRAVVLQIPFTEFRFASIEANSQSVRVLDGFMDGPINLAISKVEFNVPTQHLLFQGKVFGVAFEVIGSPPDLQFYLQEKGTIIKTITTEDDFEW